MTAPRLSDGLTDAALRLAGAYPQQWLCPVCGAVVADQRYSGPRPPVHQHRGHPVKLVERPEL